MRMLVCHAVDDADRPCDRDEVNGERTTLLRTTRKVLPMLLAITLGACGSHSSSEEPPAASRCGDDRIDLGEECDGTEPAAGPARASAAIRRARSPAVPTAGSIRRPARFRHAATARSTPPSTVIPVGARQCDGTALAGSSCEGFQGTGDLACTTGCTIACSACDGICLNGRLDPGEPCDFDLSTFAAILAGGPPANRSASARDRSPAPSGAECSRRRSAPWCMPAVSYKPTAASSAPPRIRGNGVRDGWEDCDGTDLGATTCEGSA
jgi:hypothetical protein